MPPLWKPTKKQWANKNCSIDTKQEPAHFPGRLLLYLKIISIFAEIAPDNIVAFQFQCSENKADTLAVPVFGSQEKASFACRTQTTGVSIGGSGCLRLTFLRFFQNCTGGTEVENTVSASSSFRYGKMREIQMIFKMTSCKNAENVLYY
ncbi:MAG: hypothetical protein IKD29_01065 [Lentisphaeria bacterium]|nr:hypothetical protein [Lentisphaeria bacterium]